MVKSGLLRAVTAVLLTVGATFAASGVAAAATGTPPPAGDDRAVVHSGNAVTCEQAHLAGGLIQVTATVDANTYVTVTGVPGGTTVTGIVVKGSDAYNVYLPGALGALPWKNLHSPIAGNSGKPATISHWFACGTETTSSTTKPTSSSSSTSSTSTTSETTTTTSSTTTTTSPVTTTTTAVAAATTTTTSVGTAPLAFTGFSGGWLVILAAILLLGGAALIAIPKLRARRH
ncbi:MAG TPA: hypothetical protein VGD48_22300 [Kutzneria sp.]|jgi:hypothetical protein